MLKLDLKIGDSFRIGDYATVRLEEKSGKIARLSIEADKSIPIIRASQHSAPQIAASLGLTGKH